MALSIPLAGFALHFRLDGFHAAYACIALFMWIVSLLFSPRYFRGHTELGRYYAATLLTLIGTVGVFLSDDLFTTFIFFEIMSFSSDIWVHFEGTPDAIAAKRMYTLVAVYGGIVSLAGLIWLQILSGSLVFDDLRTWAESLEDRTFLYIPTGLAMVGFAAKAGVFPLHFWMPKVHPVAPAPASALLSGALTKAGVYGMIVLSTALMFCDRLWGNLLLLLSGINMLTGALMAVFSFNLKHTLACSSMSQIGFILSGLAMTVLLGQKNALAARGTFLYMMNHSLLKLNLFLCAGAVYMNAHTLNLNSLSGFGRKKPFLHICFLIGYLGIIGMPLFNGFLSKSLIHEAVLEYAEEAGSGAFWYILFEKLFLFCGGLTAAYMTKLYVCLFWFRNRDASVQEKWDTQSSYLSAGSAVALGLSSIAPLALGLLPDLTARPLAEDAVSFLRGVPYSQQILWFSPENLKGAAVSLAIGALIFCLIARFLINKKKLKNS